MEREIPCNNAAGRAIEHVMVGVIEPAHGFGLILISKHRWFQQALLIFAPPASAAGIGGSKQFGLNRDRGQQ
jgi:hypothetical protein